MRSGPGKRGALSRQLDLLAKLRAVVRVPIEPERMLRAVTNLLAIELGQYCIADILDAQGSLRRFEISHADASRQAHLGVAREDATFDPAGRVVRLFRSGGSEMIARVPEGARARPIGDVSLLEGERVRSYMGAAVPVGGATLAVLTMVITTGTRRYDDADLATLVAVAEWTGLGVENALRAEAQPRATVAPRGASTSPPPLRSLAPPASSVIDGGSVRNARTKRGAGR